jgi:flavin reductase (DIM6/NTAB) family NADH-FMN oxidoreductase RutF
MQFDLSRTETHDAYNLLIGLVVPRPIALITSMDAEGRLNAAPFSAYNYLTTEPPIVAIGVQNRPGQPMVGKDTAQNIRQRGEFVINVVNESIAEAMNVCAVDFPKGVDELKKAGLTTAPSQVVTVPRIAQAPAALECREFQTIEVGPSRIVLGRVVAMYIDDRYVDPAGPYIRSEEMHTIGRMNGRGAYVRTRDAFFQMPRQTIQDWEKSHGPVPKPPG